MPIKSVLLVIHVECTKSKVIHTFHNILLNTPRRCDDTVNHLMLNQVFNDLPNARGDHIGCVSKENGGSYFCSVVRV